jgi:hypothetical protein
MPFGRNPFAAERPLVKGSYTRSKVTGRPSPGTGRLVVSTGIS